MLTSHCLASSQQRYQQLKPFLEQHALRTCPSSTGVVRRAAICRVLVPPQSRPAPGGNTFICAPGDVIPLQEHGVAIKVQQPVFEVCIHYNATERQVLSGARRIWAHIGHSGWRHVLDVELTCKEGPQAGLWEGTYLVPAGQLPLPTHLEVNWAFKGEYDNGRGGTYHVWDNNENRNWTSCVELSPGQGLVTASSQAQSQTSVSALMLRVEALAAKGLMSPEQTATLRTLAWSKDFSLLKLYEQAQTWADADLAGLLAGRCSHLRRPGLHVVHVAAEMAPIAKVGGLADVVTSLAKAHQQQGTLAEIVLPKYDCINYGSVIDLRSMAEIQVPWGKESVRTLVWSGVAEGLPVYFLEPHSSHNFFWRRTVYGCPDDVARFLFFSRASLEFLAWAKKVPDALHIHDWQTAAVAPLLKELYSGTSLGKAGCVLTIHNIAFQGLESPGLLELAGLDRSHVYTTERMQDDAHKNTKGEFDINLLKGGVAFADRTTTVSPRYAHEVLNTEFGMGLQGQLQRAAQAGRFMGVLNGIDLEVWDPRVDKLLASTYAAENSVEGKLACKQRLLSELGLPFSSESHPSGRPLVAVVSRLTEQKGLPLILHGMTVAVEQGAQVAVLGSAPNPAVAQQFKELQASTSQGGDVRIVLAFDEGLAHRIYAGADMILIPSAFEPCGLTQLISLRYGTVPVVRETGGLADTVHDVFFSKQPEHLRNGYVFQGSALGSVQTALSRAIDAYKNSWSWWSTQLVPRIMRQDWSWERSAKVYTDIYAAVAKKSVGLAQQQPGLLLRS